MPFHLIFNTTVPGRAGVAHNYVKHCRSVLRKVVHSLSPGLAPGPSGLRSDHLLRLMSLKKGNCGLELLDVLGDIVRKALERILPNWDGRGPG